MASIPRYNDDEINNKGMEVDFDLRKVFNMPTIEQLIFFHVNFDKCRKEIITYEKAIQDSSSRVSICFFFLCNFLKQGKEWQGGTVSENRDGVGVRAGSYVGAGDGTPSESNPRGTIIFN